VIARRPPPLAISSIANAARVSNLGHRAAYDNRCQRRRVAYTPLCATPDDFAPNEV
jgi:hypothetical protein